MPTSSIILRRALAFVAFAAALTAAAWIALESAHVLGLDFHVYRTGGAALLKDPALLYTEGAGSTEGFGLPFTYPPFAAAVFVPLAALPFPLAFGLLTAASLLVMFAVARDLAPRLVALWPALKGWVNPWTLSALWAIAGPGRDTLLLGQINLLLLGAVYLALVRGKTLVPFAVAVGLTGGIKLTPLALMLVPLAYGKIKPILIGGLTFLATALVPLLFWKDQVLEFWTEAVVDPSRVGGVDYLDNFSLRGIVERAGAPQALWLAAALLVVAATLLIMVRVRASTDRVVSLGLASASALLISPISWSHHWVWLPVLAYALGASAVALGWRERPGLQRGLVAVLVVISAVLFVSAKLIVRLAGGDPDTDLPGWAWVPGAVTAGGTLLLLLCLGASALRRRSTSPAGGAAALSDAA